MDTAQTLKQRLGEELRAYLIVSAYLFVCFAAIEMFKAAVLRDAGAAYALLGFAAAKAVVLGKFLLIAEVAGVGTRLRARTMLQAIVHRVLLLTLLLVVLEVVEELVVGAVHRQSVARRLAEFAERLPEALASALLLLLVLVPWVAATELDRALGGGSLARLLLGTPEPSGNVARRESRTP